MLHLLINDAGLKTFERCLRDVDEETILSVMQNLAKPLIAKVRANAKGIGRTALSVGTSVALCCILRSAVGAWLCERRWQKKRFLSTVSAQLLTTTNQPNRKAVEWVNKRTLFQKELRRVGILSEEHLQLMIVKAADKTTRADPFVTSFLRRCDIWHVMNSMVNELSCMAGLAHLEEVQKPDGDCSQSDDSFVLALMNPKYDYDVARFFMGGAVECEDAARSENKLRLIVVWEQELWNIVCKKIQRSEQGMLNERHERRWELLQHLAKHYKRYMGRTIMQKAVEYVAYVREEQESLEGEQQHGCLLSRGLSDMVRKLMSHSSKIDLGTQEINKELFMLMAKDLKVPENAASQIFEEFDLNHDNQVSLHEIDQSMGQKMHRASNYVDMHLMKVSLPFTSLNALDMVYSPKYVTKPQN